tara:strand:- start:341 stop:880 length:540 start_codon:yes stop_codon:yes gene_type:complete
MRKLTIFLLIMGLLNWSGLFGQKKSDSKNEVDVNKPIENPDLKRAFEIFQIDKTEENLMKVINGFLKANFLVLAVTDEMKTSKSDTNSVVVEQGSLIKFLNCFDLNNQPFLPLFTDWKEVDLWLKKRDDNTSGFIMNTFEAFEFAKNDVNYFGIVVNPGSNAWTMSKEKVSNFLEDYKK